MRNDFEDELARFIAGIAAGIWIAVMTVVALVGGYGTYHVASAVYGLIASSGSDATAAPADVRHWMT